MGSSLRPFIARDNQPKIPNENYNRIRTAIKLTMMAFVPKANTGIITDQKWTI